MGYRVQIYLTVIAGMMIGIGVLRRGLRVLLDVVLDVVNYLRLEPASRTPRARIVARYVSLLKHIGEWRDSRDGLGFSACVIVSHSQGTVITADLLRFLRAYPGVAEKDPAKGAPLYVFTMGCPLRQLYRARFPYQYGWVTPQEHVGPDPGELGVELWVNAYRSGDYIGRSLWWPESSNDQWLVGRAVEEDRHREFCVGEGAHTHYWDGWGGDIAKELDGVVARALADASGRRR